MTNRTPAEIAKHMKSWYDTLAWDLRNPDACDLVQDVDFMLDRLGDWIHELESM